jgi:LacI family transcriptional regulator
MPSGVAVAQKLAQYRGVTTPSPRARRVTLADVAAAAGVSVPTASRALRARGDMAPATRARVLAAAQRLGHTGASERRGRPRTGSSLFDLVLGHFHSPYADEVTAGARSAAAELDYDLVLTAERDSPDDDWPVRIRARGSAGVVLGLILPTRSQLSLLRDAGIPVVLMDPRSDATADLPSVRTSDRAGGAEAAEHLAGCGVDRFVIVGGSPPYRFGRARAEGFATRIAALAPGASVVRVNAQWDAALARSACARALRTLAADGGTGPIGIFACSDEMAVGAYGAASDAGLSVPDDVMVVGFDDVRGARWLSPPLTTLHQPIREMAATAIRILADAAGGAPLPHTVVELPTRLVVRGSTRPVS